MRLLGDFLQSKGLIFPLARDDKGALLYEFKLMTTGGRRQFDTTKIIDRYDRRIASTMLADFILLGQEGRTGSFALAESKTALFAVAIGAFLDAISAVFNRFAIPRLLELNTFGAEGGNPTLEHGDIESIDIEKLGAYVVALSQAGVSLTDEKTERFLRMQGGLPERDEDELGDIEGRGARRGEEEPEDLDVDPESPRLPTPPGEPPAEGN